MSQHGFNLTYAQEANRPDGLPASELPHLQEYYENILLQSDSSRIAGRLARTYAESLLAVAEERGQVDEVGEQLDSLLKDLFAKSPELETYLVSPAVGKARKDEVIDRAFGDGRALPLVHDFLKLLNHKNRMMVLRTVVVAYRALRDNRANRLRVLVESAAPLDDAQRDQLKATLSGVMNKEPVLVVRVRPELIGGMVVHAGDKVFDTSVRSKLNTLRNTLLARGSHAIQRG